MIRPLRKCNKCKHGRITKANKCDRCGIKQWKKQPNLTYNDQVDMIGDHKGE